MPWMYLFPLLLIGWAGLWYYRTKSLPVALTVAARLAVGLIVIYLATRLVWRVMVPAGVCPITTPPAVLIMSILVPLVFLGILNYLATYFPQLIATDQGYALLVGEDYHLTDPIELEKLSDDQYLITTEGKSHKVTMRGARGQAVAQQLGVNQTDME